VSSRGLRAVDANPAVGVGSVLADNRSRDVGGEVLIDDYLRAGILLRIIGLRIVRWRSELIDVVIYAVISAEGIRRVEHHPGDAPKSSGGYPVGSAEGGAVPGVRDRAGDRTESIGVGETRAAAIKAARPGPT